MMIFFQVRPKAALFGLLKQIGATHEVLTRKEILDFLKVYIVSKQMFDVYNPNIIHCKGDLLGEVFGVSQFTISDVPKLLTANCIELPDTHLQKRRRLVTKPSSSANIPTSISTTHGHVVPQTSSPLVTSTSLIKPSPPVRNLHLPHTKSRKSSSSSSCGDKTDTTENTSAKNTVVSSSDKTKNMDSVNEENTKNASSLNEIVNRTEIVADVSANTDDESKNLVSSGSDAGIKSTASTAGKNASSFETGQSCSQSEQPAEVQGHRRKRKNNTSLGESSGRKRHQTEPGSIPTVGESSRRRGTSLSITYGDDCDKDGYPWYFQVKLGDGSDNEQSEVLSVQSKETVIVQDSTDDLWFLEEDSDTVFSIEYDVESDNASPTESDLSSIQSGESFLVVCKESDVEFFADCSDSDSNDGDKELTEADNWVCIECNQSNPPVQRYCGRCWKLRTDWLGSQARADERPEDDKSTLSQETQRKDKNVSNQSREISDNDCKTVDDMLIKDLAEQRYSFSNIQLQQKDNKSTVDTERTNPNVSKAPSVALEDPCIICLTRPKTASLIHGTSGHQVCCFSCGKRLKRRGKLCPVCRRPIQKVIRNYIL
ncbi:E3 ubiquitin-protein ligase Mdm2-like [Ruditapes philippinarum]|uniref:E3 ubiquitin-protein ligase Mdm2-like n=1 Tax=Ruditapes philippinarum TaxID=129788 RepID=UPI00295B8119|nr:E3 ubiquitin-protein ligase Mdm2-like [Ruditapes philippinarum]